MVSLSPSQLRALIWSCDTLPFYDGSGQPRGGGGAFGGYRGSTTQKARMVRERQAIVCAPDVRYSSHCSRTHHCMFPSSSGAGPDGTPGQCDRHKGAACKVLGSSYRRLSPRWCCRCRQHGKARGGVPGDGEPCRISGLRHFLLLSGTASNEHLAKSPSQAR